MQKKFGVTILRFNKIAVINIVNNNFKKILFQHHPDQNKNDKKSSEKFQKINEAYSVLSKDVTRRDYDRTMLGKRPPGTTGPGPGGFQTRSHGPQSSYQTPPRYTNPYGDPYTDPFGHNQREHAEWQDFEKYRGER